MAKRDLTALDLESLWHPLTQHRGLDQSPPLRIESASGCFIIDNACFGMIAANKGTDWIGRPVEYEEAHMRFLDDFANGTEHDDLSGTCLQPHPHGSLRHI